MTAQTVEADSALDWTPAKIGALTGRRFLITGGNSGLGLETARLLHRRGADVVLACRGTERGEQGIADVWAHTNKVWGAEQAQLTKVRMRAGKVHSRLDNKFNKAVIKYEKKVAKNERRDEDRRKDLSGEYPDSSARDATQAILDAANADEGKYLNTGRVTHVVLDLGDTSSIRAAAEEMRATYEGFDAIVNCGGVMHTPKGRTKDGFETHFGVNYLGHVLLNHLLFDMVFARAGRIVSVGSLEHMKSAGILFEDLMFRKEYSASDAYIQSKLATLMYSQELARRLDEQGIDVMSVAAHPGVAKTDLHTKKHPGGKKRSRSAGAKLAGQRARKGAYPIVLAAAAPIAMNGGYYGPVALGERRGAVGESRISDVALDRRAARRLWDATEDLLDISWPVRPFS